LSDRLLAWGRGGGLVFPGLDPLHQLGELRKKTRQQGEQQRDPKIRQWISGLALAQIREDRLEGWGTGHTLNIAGTKRLGK
jgi:hypothetical protein